MFDYMDKLNAAEQKIHEAKTEDEKESAKQDWWKTAIEAFNEEIAGDITTVTGTVIHVPRIEI
jgi:hypothetical protein